VGRTTDSRVRVVSRQEPGAPVTVGLDAKPGAVTDWSAYVIGVVWSLREAGYDVGGVDIAVDGDVPAGAGLSSSAALECAVAGALNDLFELRIEPTELARLAQRAENEFVGMPCGVMDQMARSEEHTSELQSRENLVCRLLLEKKKDKTYQTRLHTTNRVE